MNKQLLAAIGLALFLGITAFWYFNVKVPEFADRNIKTFADCVKVYPVMTLQYPARCVTKDGRAFIGPTISPTPSTIGMANPASVNCVDKGGILNIVDEKNGQVGLCTLKSGKICEEWAFFRGECK